MGTSNYFETPAAPENYIYNPSWEVARGILESWCDLPVAVDIETAPAIEGLPAKEAKAEALNPYRNIIIGIAFCGEPGHAIQFSGTALKQNWDNIFEFLRLHEHQVYQNNLFDRTTFKHKQIGAMPVIEYDTMMAMHLINSSLPKDLNFLRSIYTNMPPYKQVYWGGDTKARKDNSRDCQSCRRT